MRVTEKGIEMVSCSDTPCLYVEYTAATDTLAISSQKLKENAFD